MKRMTLFNPEDNTCKAYPIGMDWLIDFAIYLETLVSTYLGCEPSRIQSLLRAVLVHMVLLFSF